MADEKKADQGQQATVTATIRKGPDKPATTKKEND
jgi:hypothetical protein